VTVSEDLVVNFWSTATLGYVTSIQGQQHKIMMRAAAVVKLDAEERLWTSDATGRINAWKLSTNTGARISAKLVDTITISGGDSVCSMTQAQDGGVILGCDGTLLKLSDRTMRELHHRPKVHRGKITCVVVAQEDLVVTGSEDYSVSIWNLTLEHLHKVVYHSGKIHALSVFQDAFLLSGGFDLTFCVYDLRSRMSCGKRMWATGAETGVAECVIDSISSICCDTGAAFAWVAARDGSLRLWRLGLEQDTPAAVGSPTWIRRQPNKP
jgi:WD40 repeat protein